MTQLRAKLQTINRCVTSLVMLLFHAGARSLAPWSVAVVRCGRRGVAGALRERGGEEGGKDVVSPPAWCVGDTRAARQGLGR